jgi:hypothetical protein
MADQPNALSRIEAAIQRIEAANARRDTEAAALARRHAVLRARIGEAIVSLDQVVAQGGTHEASDA